MEFKEKFVGFIDVLGFKELVREAEAGTGISLDELLTLIQCLGSPKDRERFVNHGPRICPHSQYKSKDLDFRITQISDCAIVSTEISPAGAINLISHCWDSVIELMPKGILCRGFITRGRVYHTDTQVIGSGYQTAYEGEAKVKAFAVTADDFGTPFVEIDTSVCAYVDAEGDRCVKDMFGRLTKTDQGVTALFPFQSISHSFAIGVPGMPFDAQKELAANENVRKLIGMVKGRVMERANAANPRVMRKIQHYVNALEAQLKECDKTESVVRRLGEHDAN
jgi:hypothetical protein